MSAAWARRLTLAIAGLLPHIFPAAQAGWARAMAHEIVEMEDGVEALAFAWGCLRVAVGQAAVFHLHRFFILPKSGDAGSGRGGPTVMENPKNALSDTRRVGLACAAGAAGLGLAYLTAAGAPMRYVVINAAALLLGVVAFVGIGRSPWRGGRLPGGVMLVLAGALLATAWLGASVEGATRWARIGPLAVQVSLLVLPAMIIVFAQRRDTASTAAMAVAAVALALQPDRAMAGVLVAALGAVAIHRLDRHIALALIAAAAAFGATLLVPDTPAAAPFVDQILYSAFDVHLAAGAAVVTGALLLVVPAIVGRLHDKNNPQVHAAFGATWLAIIVAAAAGNYPTPVVGHGGSAILGYLLSLAFVKPAPRLQGQACADAGAHEQLAGDSETPSPSGQDDPSASPINLRLLAMP